MSLGRILRVRICDQYGERTLYGRQGLQEARRIMREAARRDVDLIRRGRGEWRNHVFVDDVRSTTIAFEWTRRLEGGEDDDNVS